MQALGLQMHKDKVFIACRTTLFKLITVKVIICYSIGEVIRGHGLTLSVLLVSIKTGSCQIFLSKRKGSSKQVILSLYFWLTIVIGLTWLKYSLICPSFAMLMLVFFIT